MGVLLFPGFFSCGKVTSMSDQCCWRSCCTLSDGKGNNNSCMISCSRVFYHRHFLVKNIIWARPATPPLDDTIRVVATSVVAFSGWGSWFFSCFIQCGRVFRACCTKSFLCCCARVFMLYFSEKKINKKKLATGCPFDNRWPRQQPVLCLLLLLLLLQTEGHRG